MKAIVVRQPWATLIALGVKTIETRPSPPNGAMRPEGVRGLPGCSLERGERIAIVAGARAGTAPGEDLGDSGWYWESTAGDPSCVVNWKMPAEFHDAPLGAVVCTVAVDDALPIVADLAWCDDGGVGIAGAALSTDPDDSQAEGWVYLHNGDPFGVGGLDLPGQLPLGDFTPGRWGWLLSDPQPCDPIPCKGKQGVFVPPDDVAAQIGGAR